MENNPSPKLLELRVPVVVHARDPISREGALRALDQDARIEVCDAESPGGVTLIVDHTLTPGTLTELRRAIDDGSKAVLVLDALLDDEFHEVVGHGVSAVVWRHEATRGRLVQAILRAARGDGDLPADLLGRLIGQLRTGTAPAAGPGSSQGLTHREAEVVRLVADGLGTAEIARQLCYSERTIKDTLYKLTTRLRLRNRAHAVAYALRRGYI
ncbi:MAG TPA: LuxR C-terminal-related transcriptional regulator [Streptomyces sp.]